MDREARGRIVSAATTTKWAWAVRYIFGALLTSVTLPAFADTKAPPMQRGEASYYWHSKKTANGEPFNPEAMTCAHKTLPFHTTIRVTNLRNGRSVVCRVNDRGPFTRGRVVDLSRGGARAIGMIETGIARVSLEVLRPNAPARRGTTTVTSDKSEASQLGGHLSAVPLQ
jgi:rare lipoprotein A (peptidoglycan hydrolase)